jgi:arabinogalactan endo-1,4-beta-galactosidase
MLAAHVPFVVIGLSYRPRQQGSLSALKADLDVLAQRVGKPLVISAHQFPYAGVPGYGIYSTTVPHPETVPGDVISPDGKPVVQGDSTQDVRAPRALSLTEECLW